MAIGAISQRPAPVGKDDCLRQAGGARRINVELPISALHRMGSRWIEFRGEIAYVSQLEKALRRLTRIGLSILIGKPMQAITANIEVITNLVDRVPALFTDNHRNWFDQVDTVGQHLTHL